MAPEDREQKYVEIRKAAEESLYFFCKVVLEMRDLNDYHKELCDWIQAGKRRQMVLWPRACFKTSIGVGFCLWKVAKNPEERILLMASTREDSWALLNLCRQMMEQRELLRGLWPEVFYKNPYSDSPQWSNSSLTVKRSGIYAESTFEVGSLESNIVGRHYTGALIDDLVTKDTSATDAQIKKVIEFWQLLRPVFVPMNAQIDYWELISGTRWHDADLYGWIMDKVPSVSVNKRGIWADNAEEDTIMGSILDKAKLSEIRETMDAAQFAAQYLNDPISSETAKFKLEDLAPYTYRKVPPGPFYCTVTMDPARKVGKSSDRTAIMSRLLSTDGHWYIEKTWAGRLHLSQRATKLFDFCMDLESFGYRPVQVGIEDVDGLDIPEFNSVMAQRRHYWSITEIRPRGRTKASRIDQLVKFAEQHRLHLREEDKETLTELIRCPHGRYDDRADALSMHADLKVGNPSAAAPRLPYLSPDAIAKRVKYRMRNEGEREPVGAMYAQDGFRATEESWVIE